MNECEKMNKKLRIAYDFIVEMEKKRRRGINNID